MLIRINVKEAKLGMYIHEVCGSWLEHPFWKSHFLLDSEADLKRLRGSGVSEIWIDDTKGKSPEHQSQSMSEVEATASVDAILAVQEEAQHVAEVLAEIHEGPKKLSVAEEMKQANLDTNVILFSMWTEAIKNFAEYGKGNVIFLDGSSEGMEKTMRQIMAMQKMDAK